MFKLSDFYDSQIKKDGGFTQTQFSNTSKKNSICFATSKKYLSQANNNDAISAIITNHEIGDYADQTKGLLCTESPEKIFYELHNCLFKKHGMCPPMAFGISESAVIHPSVIVSERVLIRDNVEIGPGAVIGDYSILENGVSIGPNAVIGAAGHFFKSFPDGLFRVDHAGGTHIKAGVQILAGAIISKSVHTDFTSIGMESVISINAHVGHGCIVGKRCIVAGSAQISGYTTIGDDVWIGPSASVRNLIHVGDRARIEIGSVVVEDVPQDARVSGNFARPHTQHVRQFLREKKR